MFDKAKDFFTNPFEKIKGTEFYKKNFNKQTDSLKMKRFLKNVSRGVYTVENGVGKTYVSLDDDLFVVSIAIDNEYVRGIELDVEDLLPGLKIRYPSVTVLGENFLRNQTFFNRHPFLEKVVIALISSIITLLIGYFSK